MLTPSLGGYMPSRTEPGLVVSALASLLLSASCGHRDAVAPTGGPGTLGVSAKLSSAPASEFYVSPAGSPSGDGSFSNPWDLATALNGPAAVTPGSTIWLRGGTYTNGTFFGAYWSNLTGSVAAPIVVRQYPGERATVTRALFVRGAYTWYWGFEVVHPAPHVGYGYGISNLGPGTKLINLVVHNASASGIFIGPEAANAEVYGSIVYNNGRTDNLDHGIYCQSQTRLLVKDNIVFANWAFGVHCFASDGAHIRNVDIEGNVAFNNYVWSEQQNADIFVGGHVPASGITVNENYTYRTHYTNTMTASMGDLWVSEPVTNQDLVYTNNYFAGGWSYVGAWTTATVTGNTLYNFATGGMVDIIGDVSGHTWSGNTFFGDDTARAWRYNGSSITTFDGWRALTGFTEPGKYAGSAPTGVKIAVRPNQYEPGRANIIVYNWAQQSAVSVDVAGILNPGDHYEVRHAQDFYGAPVARGIYTGDLLELPMVSTTPPTPLGTTTAQPAPITGPTFNVFVLTKTARRPCAPNWGDGPGSCRRPLEGDDVSSGARGYR